MPIGATPFVTVGTSRENTLQVKGDHVSRSHTVFFQTTDGWDMYDLGSTNGTFVNGERVYFAHVVDSDEITLGRSFVIEGRQLTTALRKNERGNISGEFLRIGKAEQNDLILSDPHVSRYHAFIRKTDVGFFVYDAGSTNGLFLNGVRINNTQFTKTDLLGFGRSEQRSGNDLIQAFGPVDTPRNRTESKSQRSRKTKWFKAQLERFKHEQNVQLEELENRHSRNWRRLVGGVLVGVIGMGLIFSVLLTFRPDMRVLLEKKRSAIVMVICEESLGDNFSETSAEELELYASRGSSIGSQGTGFIYKNGSRYVVITNRHVVEPLLEAQRTGRTGRAYVLTQGRKQVFDVKLDRVHTDQDLAALTFLDAKPNGPILELEADWSSVEDGDVVGCISFPLGFRGQVSTEHLKADLTTGHVTNKFPEIIKYNLESAPGASGGPIFNSEGKVIAINRGQSKDQEGNTYQSMNWGVPARYVAEMLKQPSSE